MYPGPDGQQEYCQGLPDLLHGQFCQEGRHDAAGQNQINDQVCQLLLSGLRENALPPQEEACTHKDKQLSYQMNLRTQISHE